MKIDVINDGYIIYLNKYNIIDINFTDMNSLENNFKILVKRLNKYYNIDIKGYYNIKIYMDKFYGVVLEFLKEDIDYYDFDSDDTIAMRLKKIDTNFLYEVEDTLFAHGFKENLKLIIKNNNFYFKIIKELESNDYLKLIEMSKIIYN